MLLYFFILHWLFRVVIIPGMDHKKIIKILLWIAGILAALRLLSLGFTPLTDTTEARYAEIGRIMFDSGNYITPMLDGAPFWAKPPLSFWATAGSYHLFGVNDFAAHFPHFLFLIGAATLAFFFVRRWRGEVAAAVTVAAIATMPVFLYLAGGVMTDPALAFCVTLCMVAFYNAINNERPKLFGYLFFIGMALGLLAKGPLMFVLVGLPIFIWVLMKNKWRDMFCTLPWFGGIAIMFAITLPWYILAERATPGFLEYFIIGEHFERYLTPHWAGDLYGGGRGGFLGKIWMVYLIAIIPWSIWFAVKMFARKFRRAVVDSGFLRDNFLFYILAFAFAQLIFFTFSKNIVPAYVLPAMIPTAVLIAVLIGETVNLKMFKWFAYVTGALLIAAIALQIDYPKWSAILGISDKYFIEQYAIHADSAPLILYKTQNYSAEFYTAAHGIKYEFIDDAKQLKNYRRAFVLTRVRDSHDLNEMSFRLVTAWGSKMVLREITPPKPH